MGKEEEIPKQEENVDFFIPKKCCPDRLSSPEFPSPEDCLPPDELAKLNEKIVDANELLLNLALDDDRSVQETYQKVFDGLIGLPVDVTNQLDELIEGRVILSGFDFVALRYEEVEILIPHGQIEFIKPAGRFAEPFPDPELLDIDPCLRRNLTFHFGEVVSSSPELIQLFFRIPLAIYLLIFVDKRIKVKLEDTQVEGILTKVNKESIVLKMDEVKSDIPIDKIFMITLKVGGHMKSNEKS